MTKPSALLTTSLFAALLLASPKAFCWADLGHSIVGAVAEENIKPTTRDFVRGVLGVEPLATAAIWPDHVRDDERFAHKDDEKIAGAANTHNFNEYHYCEIPVGYTYANRPTKYLKDCHGAITGAIELLKDVKGNHQRSEKMIALRYLAHVMGDITQPLHVGNGFDMGGNVCQIEWQKSPKASPYHTNLHSFWDDTIVTYLGTTYADPATGKRAALYYGQYLEALKTRHADMFTEAAKKQYGQGVLDDWLQESATLRETIYPDDSKVMETVPKGEEYKNRPYCLWFADQVKGTLGSAPKVDPSKVPVLDAAYADRFTGTVEMQLLKGGLRLAKTLDDIADSVARTGHPVNIINTKMQEEILTKVQASFMNVLAASGPVKATPVAH